jgi:hypothetical protein
MTSTSRTALIALVAIAMAAPACRKNERNFVPAPAANRDGGFAFETAPGTDAIAIPIDRGDGGVASGDGDGDGDGDSTGPTEAKDLITFLDQELPADIDEKRLFTKLARKCSETRKCSDKACGSVLASCSGDDVAGCGTMLLGACPAFAAIAAGASGDALGAKTETWVRDLWGDLVVKLRLSLPEKAQGQVDKLAGRHQL